MRPPVSELVIGEIVTIDPNRPRVKALAGKVWSLQTAVGGELVHRLEGESSEGESQAGEAIGV